MTTNNETLAVFAASLAVLTDANAASLADKNNGKPSKLLADTALKTAERAMLAALTDDGSNKNLLADMMSDAVDIALTETASENNRAVRRVRVGYVATYRTQCLAYVAANPDKGVMGYARKLYEAREASAKIAEAREPFMPAAVAAYADENDVSDAVAWDRYEQKAPDAVADMNARADAFAFEAAFIAQVTKYLACPTHGDRVADILSTLVAARSDAVAVAVAVAVAA
jgi:hypothetical protein